MAKNVKNKNNTRNARRNGNIKRSNKAPIKNGSIKKRFVKKKVGQQQQDARQKILQHKRQTVVDARDILVKKAKTHDARDRLNKIRQDTNTIRTPSGSIKPIGRNILRKTDRNGKVSLMTNKAAAPVVKATDNINATIQKQLGLLNYQAGGGRMGGVKKPPRRNVGQQTALIRKMNLAENASVYHRSPLTVSSAAIDDVYHNDPYKWSRPELRPASQMISTLPRTRADVDEWQSFSVTKPVRLGPPTYVDLDAVDDEEMPMAPPPQTIRKTISLQGSSRVSNIHSRLDSQPPIQQETHGIFAQPKTKVVVPVGHRIVVSNLQSTVTQDDIKELFEDIGQLLAARLVRPGVAEVIYKNLKDAQKAVDTYHNRQLDGQPMKCLLVNKRPVNQPTAPALSKTSTQGILAGNSRKSTSSPTLVPDINTIHKVLFQRK